jgi:hypothetical protein
MDGWMGHWTGGEMWIWIVGGAVVVGLLVFIVIKISRK